MQLITINKKFLLCNLNTENHMRKKNNFWEKW